MPLEYWPLRSAPLLSLLLNLLLGLLDKVHPLVVRSKDLGEDDEGGTEAALHLACNRNLLPIPPLLLVIEYFQSKDVALSGLSLLSIRPHLVLQVPSLKIAVVLEHLDRLVGPEDYVAGPTALDLLTTNCDIIVTHRLRWRLHGVSMSLSCLSWDMMATVWCCINRELHAVLAWGDLLLVSWNRLILGWLFVAVEVLVHAWSNFKQSHLGGRLLRFSFILTGGARDKRTVELYRGCKFEARLS